MHRILNKIAGALFIGLFFNHTSAQQIVVGNKVQIHSKILGEVRELWVSLPISYNDSNYNQQYPVMYLLDPDFHFQSMVAVHKALTGGFYNYMPEMIIVGIVNTDRSRDMTPTNSYIMHSGKKYHTSSGGANKFLAFITNELVPFIDSSYRTCQYRLINGHSFGGLFALYVLLEKPRVFNAYIVHDPSIWWDDKTLYKSALERWDDLSLKGISLYFAMANNDGTEKDRFMHSSTITDFNMNVLEGNSTNGLHFKFEFFETEDHGTIFLPAAYKAMRYIFNGICLPVKKIPQNPDLICRHYKAVSKSIGFNLLPAEKLLNNLANYCIELEHIDSAKKILELNIANNPKSKQAITRLANLYLELGDENRARQLFEKAKNLYPLTLDLNKRMSN